MCVCVWERESERRWDRKANKDTHNSLINNRFLLYFIIKIHFYRQLLCYQFKQVQLLPLSRNMKTNFFVWLERLKSHSIQSYFVATILFAFILFIVVVFTSLLTEQKLFRKICKPLTLNIFVISQIQNKLTSRVRIGINYKVLHVMRVTYVRFKTG